VGQGGAARAAAAAAAPGELAAASRRGPNHPPVAPPCGLSSARQGGPFAPSAWPGLVWWAGHSWSERKLRCGAQPREPLGTRELLVPRRGGDTEGGGGGPEGRAAPAADAAAAEAAEVEAAAYSRLQRQQQRRRPWRGRYRQPPATTMAVAGAATPSVQSGAAIPTWDMLGPMCPLGLAG
jgi:hypothetical protein